MINLLVQAPRRITGVQLYASLGAGLYQERGGPTAATNVASGAGGGIRIPLLGPFGLRVDYRVFSLRGSGLDPPLQRIYAGVNLAF
jgi:hemolysin activation/secretion protein